jgi:hypothetical protein
VVGLSDAIRTITIEAPTGCTVDAGATWRVYNGYFSADGTFNTEEAAAGRDTDGVSVAVPTSDAVAGKEIPVNLKVNDSSAGIPGEWNVDEPNAGSLVLLRRTLFTFKDVDNRMEFTNEPYTCDLAVEGAGTLLRASWTSKRYLRYAGRSVSMEYRLTNGPDAAWANRFLASELTDHRGYVELYDLVGAEEDGISGMLPDDGPPCGQTIVYRGHYAGDSTSSGNKSTGDAVSPGWFVRHLKLITSAAGVSGALIIHVVAGHVHDLLLAD